MSLLVRVNLALIVVFAVGATITGFVCRAVLQENAEREIRTEAGLMMDSALAVRDYTAKEIAPLLRVQMQSVFLPQSVPAYAATENFLRVQQTRRDYSYHEATLNPTNLRDRATDWEADVIQRFRSDPGVHEIVGERETPMGRSLFLARPISAQPECLVCHSTAEAAPATVIEKYGRNNGFGWQAGDVIGAQVVSVPIAAAEMAASGAFRTFLVALGTVFVTLLVVVNLVMYALVVRPVRRMARIADQLSVGDMSAAEFPATGGAEIAALGRAFNRMRKSLDKALKILESGG